MRDVPSLRWSTAFRRRLFAGQCSSWNDGCCREVGRDGSSRSAANRLRNQPGDSVNAESARGQSLRHRETPRHDVQSAHGFVVRNTRTQPFVSRPDPSRSLRKTAKAVRERPLESSLSPRRNRAGRHEDGRTLGAAEDILQLTKWRRLARILASGDGGPEIRLAPPVSIWPYRRDSHAPPRPDVHEGTA